MTTFPVVLRGLPATACPVTVEILDAESRVVLWADTATGPGAMRIPGRGELGGRRTAARVTFADGTVQESDRP